MKVPSLSRPERQRLRSIRYQDQNISLERVPGWRRLAEAGLVELIKVPGIDIWVAQSTEAGRAWVDGPDREG